MAKKKWPRCEYYNGIKRCRKNAITAFPHPRPNDGRTTNFSWFQIDLCETHVVNASVDIIETLTGTHGLTAKIFRLVENQLPF
jgi:hypothetical protein